MKKTISIILSIITICTFTFMGCAAGNETTKSAMEIILQINNPKMIVNGAEKPIDPEGTSPVIVNDRTLLPVRAVVEEMGGTVQWDDNTREVTLQYNNDEVKLTIASAMAELNEATQTLDTAPMLINNRTMLPIRFIAESFKFHVAWEQATQTVTITKNAEIEITPSPTVIPQATESNSNALILYFSATGTTKALAEKIANASGADICELIPEIAYTSADLNYNSDCRANAEQQDDSARPRIKELAVNVDNYDTIIIGYPIWWGTLPKVIYTFSESYDLSGKTIMPFCTSGGSSISQSVSDLKAICPNSVVTDGFRGTHTTSEAQLKDWLENNGFGQKGNNTEADDMLNIQIGNRTLTATLVDNSSTAALKELLAKRDITINMHDYGNFEKVGSLGSSLPTNDAQITTEAGDLILYQGNSFVIYYDTNSWNFTKLGKINDVTQSELKSLLGEGDITVTISRN